MDYGKIMQAINASPLPTRAPRGSVAVPLNAAQSNVDTHGTSAEHFDYLNQED